MISDKPARRVDNIKRSSDYVKMFSDAERYNEWLEENIEKREVPPVSFLYGGIHSDRLPWTKEISKVETAVDFPDDDPQKRSFYTVTYTACGLEIELKVTSYPHYPIAEYDAVLKNLSGKNSEEIENLLSIDSVIYKNVDIAELHSFRGANYLESEFEPMLDKIYAGEIESDKHFEVTNGKPTHTFLQNFNAEIPSCDGGVIPVISWQGNWKADFSVSREGDLRFSAGEYGTKFVLLDGENVRLPSVVLLFYKGDFQCGQNIWRRWFADCNLLRYSGKRLGKYVLACLSGCGPKDVGGIRLLNESDVREYITYTEQDACWYPCDNDDWEQVGNWYADTKKYPNGLKDVVDASHKAGLPFCLWFEPERVSYGTKTFRDLKGKIIAIKNGVQFAPIPDENGRPQILEYDDIPASNKYNLVNYAVPGAAEYMLEEVDKIITENGIDWYRQDFNMEPGPYWDAYDEKTSREMGIPRYGLTCEKHATAYLWFLGELMRRHPGMIMDICASGGMRYDLESARFGFMHTRTDWFRRVNASQVHTYTLAQWMTVVGTGVLNTGDEYEIRSKITPGVGIGCFTDPNAETGENIMIYDWYPSSEHPKSESEDAVLDAYKRLLPFIKEKDELADYALYPDFYVLSTADFADDSLLAYQFNDPDKGGICAVYVRDKAESGVCLRGLASDSEYEWFDIDENVVRQSDGRTLMEEGISFSSDVPHAFIFKFIRK